MSAESAGHRRRRRSTLALLGAAAATVAVTVAATVAIAAPDAGAAPTRTTTTTHTPVTNMNLTGTRRMPTSTSVRANAAGGVGGTLFAISPGHQRVMEYRSPGHWVQIGGQAAHLYAGLGHLFATNPTSGNIYEYAESTHTWYYVGGPGRVFVRGNGPDGHFALYALSPGGQRVMMWQEGRPWVQVGDGAAWLYSGFEDDPTTGVFATDPRTGNINKYDPRQRRWTQIGTSGRSFAGDGDDLYGITPDGKAVMHWTGVPMQWTKLGDAAGQIYAGADGDCFTSATICGVLATNPTTGAVYRHYRSGGGWQRIGGPGQDFQIDIVGNVYGQNSTGIYELQHGGTSWDNIGGPAAEMAVAQ